MKNRLWIPLALLLLASLACSLGGAAEKARQAGEEVATEAASVATEVGEEVATQAPAEEEQASEEAPTEESASEEAPAEVDEDALEGLDSYRAHISMQWTPESGTPESMVMEQEHTRDPAAQRFIMDAGEEETFEWVQIEDQSWYCFGDKCTQSQADADEVVTDFGAGVSFEPSDIVEDTDFRSAGQETVDGIRTQHYILELSKAEAAMLAEGEVFDVEGEAWIADEPDLPTFVVRFVMTWKETREDRTGSAELSYKVYDVNAPITIEPPKAAEGSGLPEDVPAYPNASEMVSMAGMITFTTSDDVTTVADFYREEMPAQGWKKDSDENLGEMVNQTWKKDERTLTLMVSPDDGGSGVVINIE